MMNIESKLKKTYGRSIEIHSKSNAIKTKYYASKSSSKNYKNDTIDQLFDSPVEESLSEISHKQY